MGEPWARTKAVRLSPARVRGEYDAWGCEKRGQYRSSLLTDIPVTSCLSRDMMGDQSVFRSSCAARTVSLYTDSISF